MHLTRADLDAATEIVYRHMAPTPQYAWPLLTAEIGAEVWVKHEDATPIGAFKVRGGLVFVARLRRSRPDVRGLVSATRGNHGQSLAYAGREYHLPVVIVVPEGNSVEKNAAMVGFGAEVLVHGHDFQSALEHCAVIARERGFEAVPPFHPDLVAGVATYAVELFDAAGELDAVYVPVGMGSGINGLIGVRDLLGMRTDVIGVVSDRAPAYQLSFSDHRPTRTELADTFVDGVACRSPDPDALEAMYNGAARILAVSDDAVAAAMRLCFRAIHHLPEPAGAIALAGLLSDDLRTGRDGRPGYQRIGVIMTGSNLDTPVAADVLAGHTPAP